MKKPKWNRSLGTSKREQGIVTPKCPNKAQSKRYKKFNQDRKFEDFDKK